MSSPNVHTKRWAQVPGGTVVVAAADYDRIRAVLQRLADRVAVLAAHEQAPAINEPALVWAVEALADDQEVAK